MTIRSAEIEKANLEAHVELCQQRYEHLELRLATVEEKVEEIHDDMHKSHNSLVKVIIGTTGTVIAGLLSTIVVILMNMK